MRISFKGELSANYMVIENVTGFSKDEFGVKMLEYNKLKSLLRFTYESINGKTDLLYDISSRQALSAYFEGGRFTGDMMRNFVFSLKYLVDTLEEYLLDADNIMLKKECVFTDPETEEFYYCYNPYYNGDLRLELGIFFDELLSAIDYEDPEAVKLAYDLHRICHKENFTMEEMTDKLEAGPVICLTEFTDKEESVLFETLSAAEYPEERNLAEKRDREIGGPGLIKKISSYLKGKNVYDVVDDIDNGRLIKKIKEISSLEVVEAFKEPEKYEAFPELKLYPEEIIAAEDLILETTILDAEYEDRHRLVGLGSQQGRIIELDRYPFTIGKLKEQSDAEINEPTVSRMHCRIHENSMKEGQFFFEDLNSKNGSYVNNIRLTPYRKVPLRSGDIIKIAREEFCFR